MTESVSKRSRRYTEKREMAERVNAAVIDVQVAARAAAELHAATAKRDGEGRETGPWGSTDVYVFAPSYRFRTALIDAKIIEQSYRGDWKMDYSACGVNEHLRARGRGSVCDAVRTVLRRHFPSERFSVGW